VLAPLLLADQAASFFDDSSVKEIRITFSDPNWYNTLYQSHDRNPEDPYFPARFQYGDTVIPVIGARFKGNSSFRRNGVKKPFKLDFNWHDSNATFLGLKKLNLHNGDLQPEFLHEKLFLEYAGKYIAALRAVHVRLYVNDVYYGLYLAVEQPDKTMMQSRFGSDEDGNLWEAGESALATMEYLGPDPAAYYRRYELKTNESANDYSGLISLLDILNNTPLDELPSKLEPIMDVENVLHGMAMNALFTNMESYLGTASEYFLYQRSRDNRFVHIHWDTNETFGSTGDGTPRIPNPFTMDPFTIPTGSFPGSPGVVNNRPLVQRLWAVNRFRRLYLQMLARYLREGFDGESFYNRGKTIADRIRADFIADPNKAYTISQFDLALTNRVTVNGFTTYGIREFVAARAAYLRPYLNALAQPTDLRLNELVTQNSGALRDEAGDTDPWVEIVNMGPGSLSTSGFYLSDDPQNPTKWALPPRTLKDGEFLIVWLDGETGEGDTHANFRLSAAGGMLTLYASLSGIDPNIDAVSFEAIGNTLSYARVGMLGASWALTTAPTPGAENRIIPPQAATPVSPGTGLLLVNEFMADNDSAFEDPDERGAFEDWFEIYNPGAAPVDMSGMYISDSLNNPTKWRVPAGVVVPARGHIVFMADGETAQGSLHTSWSLSASGESISIHAADGVTLLDRIVFGAQRKDIAVGRTSDGAATWSLFLPATPGSANVNPLANWVVNAAGYQTAPVAPGSIASAFAASIATSTAAATTTPLPTELAGVSIHLVTGEGARLPAPLYFVSAQQANFLVPEGTPAGKHRLEIRRANGTVQSGDLLVTDTAPGLFAANANGSGVGALGAVRVSENGKRKSNPTLEGIAESC
jgi:hypothetical protein